MKTYSYQKRFYRSWMRNKDLFRGHVSIMETDLEILCDRAIEKKFLLKRIALYRGQLENYITRDIRFLTSLKPIEVELTAPAIIKEMTRQARKANVGPMAAVAGAMAQFLGQDLLKKGCQEIIIENGGDIFLKIKKTRRLGLYAGRSKFSGRLSLKIDPRMTPLGICTSSGTLGHSLSFGCADSVTVFCRNAALADAVATATGNLVNTPQDLPKAIKFARSIKTVSAVLIVLKNNLASWGKINLVCSTKKI